MYSNSQTNNHYISKINKAIDYIELNLENSITLNDLAKAAQFSKFHFNRIFSLLIGETPFQFVTRVRVEKAASLLRSTKNLNISEIALKCGFSDVAVFSKNFKKHFKTSATQYKRDKLKNSNNKQNHLLTKPYFCQRLQTIKWRINMVINKGVEVKKLPKITVAYVRNIGPWNGEKMNT
jgi:AraC family transcriptional regulator